MLFINKLSKLFGWEFNAIGFSEIGFTSSLVRIGLIIAALTSLFSVTGCYDYFTYRKTTPECVDWYRQGFEDGRNGEQHNVNCMVEGCMNCATPLAVDRYQAGWNQGIRYFCVPQMGWELGRAGKPYPCFCPPDLAGPFRAAWYQGVKCYYTPELGCGAGCTRTYCSPSIECRDLKLYRVPDGCPCKFVK